MIERQSIPDVWTYTPRRHGDDRGWFSETFNARGLEEMLGGAVFVQDNQSLSAAKGTLRGMHFQIPPKAQDKLVSVVRGAVLDVGRYSPQLAELWQMGSLPILALRTASRCSCRSFAHGLLTLESNTEVLYKVSEYYSRDDERGLAWDDPAIGVDWTLPWESLTIAELDRRFPRLAQIESFF